MTECCETFSIISSCYTIELGMPIWGGEDNKINKQLVPFQFWTDNYAVHDVGINSQPLVLTGIEVLCGSASANYATICFPLCFPLCFVEKEGAAAITTEDMHARFIHLHEIMDNHEEVTISGLGDCMDAVYIIKDLKVDTIPKHGIDALSWSLTLEKRRNV